MRSIQERIVALGKTDAGRALLSDAFRTCTPLRSAADADDLNAWFQVPWNYLAMGDYPFPSGYIIHGKGTLPPYPMRVACAPLADGAIAGNDTQLLAAARDAIEVYYNFTHAEPCFAPFGARAAAASLPLRMGANMHSILQRPTAQSIAAERANACTGDWGASGEGKRSKGRETQRAGSCATDPLSSSYLPPCFPRLPVLHRDCAALYPGHGQGAREDHGQAGPSCRWCSPSPRAFALLQDMFYPLSNFDFQATAEGCKRSWGIVPREDWATLHLASKVRPLRPRASEQRL